MNKSLHKKSQCFVIKTNCLLRSSLGYLSMRFFNPWIALNKGWEIAVGNAFELLEKINFNTHRSTSSIKFLSLSDKKNKLQLKSGDRNEIRLNEFPLTEVQPSWYWLNLHHRFDCKINRFAWNSFPIKKICSGYIQWDNFNQIVFVERVFYIFTAKNNSV